MLFRSDAYGHLARLYQPGDPAYHAAQCSWALAELAEAASVSEVPEVPEAFKAAAPCPLPASCVSGDAPPASSAVSAPLARVVHCAVLCSMERSVSLIRSGAGGGPAGLAGTASDAVVAAKKESLDTTGGTVLPRPGFIDVPREAA